FARQTVAEARAARNEATAGHLELVEIQRAATEAARRAASDEASARRRAAANQVVADRLAAAARVAEILTEVAATAQVEQQRYGDGFPLPLGELRIMPTILGRLRAALAALRTLGGPDITTASQLARDGAGSTPGSVLGSAYQAMYELETLATNHDAF